MEIIGSAHMTDKVKLLEVDDLLDAIKEKCKISVASDERDLELLNQDYLIKEIQPYIYDKLKPYVQESHINSLFKSFSRCMILLALKKSDLRILDPFKDIIEDIVSLANNMKSFKEFELNSELTELKKLLNDTTFEKNKLMDDFEEYKKNQSLSEQNYYFLNSQFKHIASEHKKLKAEFSKQTDESDDNSESVENMNSFADIQSGSKFDLSQLIKNYKSLLDNEKVIRVELEAFKNEKDKDNSKIIEQQSTIDLLNIEISQQKSLLEKKDLIISKLTSNTNDIDIVEEVSSKKMYTEEQQLISSFQDTSVNVNDDKKDELNRLKIELFTENDKTDEINKLSRELVAEKEYTKYLEDELRLSKREIDLLKQFHARKLELNFSMNSSGEIENKILNLSR